MTGWLIFALLMAAKLLIDYRQWLNKKRIDHDIEAAVLAALLIAPAIFLPPFWLSYPMLAAWAWVLIDMGMATLLTRNPFYIGTTSKLDRLQRKYPALRVFKYILPLILTALWLYL
jgi:hypothetical protein